MKLLAPNSRVKVAGLDSEGIISFVTLALDTNGDVSTEYTVVDDQGAEIAIVFREELTPVGHATLWELNTHH